MRHTPVGCVSEHTDLLDRRRGDVGAAVTHVDTEQTGQTVEVAFTLGVDEVATLTTNEHRKVTVPGVFTGEMRAEVTTGTCPQFGAVHDHLLAFRMAVSHNITAEAAAGQNQKQQHRWIQLVPVASTNWSF